MKILSVKFLNLNSLRGEREINFNKEPFTNSGIFAITGPTGAGKTTILDAITAALYGKVHRHDDVKEIMSRHTGECFAEVEFEMNSKAYRAKWSVHRSRGMADGNFRNESMELAELPTGKMIGGHTVTATKNAIIELCGLDYSQFLRSVILSQGDFTKFLKASDGERSDLLEKITDTGIYSDISRYIFSKQRDEKEKLELLSAKLEDTTLLSEEEVQGHQVRLNELSVMEKTKKDEKEQITKFLNWLSAIEKLKAQMVGHVAELSEKELVFRENQSDFRAWEQHELAITFRPQLVEIKTVTEQVGSTQQEINQLTFALPGYLTVAAETLAVFGEATNRLKEAQLQLGSNAPLLEQVAKMDTNLENLDALVERLKIQVGVAQQTVKTLKADEEFKIVASEKLEQRLIAIEQWLNSSDSDKTIEKQLITLQQFYKDFAEQDKKLSELKKEKTNATIAQQAETQKAAQNQTVLAGFQTATQENKGRVDNLTTQLITKLAGQTQEELELELNRLPLLLQTCEQQYRIALNYKQGTDAKERLVSEITLAKELIVTKEKVIADYETDKEIAGKHLEDLRELVKIQERIQKYEADRGTLSDGDPCPLCGAVHHPYAKEGVRTHVSEAEQKCNQQQLVFNEIQQTVQREGLLLNTLEVTLHKQEDQLTETEKNLESLAGEFETTNSKLPVPLQLINPAGITQFVQTTRNSQDLLQLRVSSIRAIAKEILEAQNILATLKEKQQAATGQSELIKERLHSYAVQLERVDGLVTVTEQKLSALEIELNKILQPLGITFMPEKFAQIQQNLENRATAYAKANTDLQQIKMDQATLKTELTGIKQSLVTRSTEAANQSNEYEVELAKRNVLRSQRLELFGTKDPGVERGLLEQAIASYNVKKDAANQLNNQQQQLVENTKIRLVEENKRHSDLLLRIEKLEQNFLIALNGKGVPDIATLESLFLSEDNARNIGIVRKELEGRMAVLKGLIETTKSALATESNKKLTIEPAAELQEKLTAIELEFSALNQEVGKLKQVLFEDNLTRIKFAEIARQIELQKTEFARWNTINMIIGSADGKRFSRFAQGLTLTRLVDLANLHLQKFSDRYQILKSTENDLELLIVDGYQADVVRLTASLSGGESFLVSLSLALGLSDLASHKVQINSLFIDEGFGTLDAETLDTAISALENLQAKGKTIGIISHVEALKERISTQIQLSKLPGGTGKIKIVEYGKVLYEV